VSIIEIVAYAIILILSCLIILFGKRICLEIPKITISHFPFPKGANGYPGPTLASLGLLTDREED
jgi:hypothetical protein